MPTVSLERDEIFRRLGRTFTDHEFDELCFEFGVELDDVTSERDEAIKVDTGNRLSKGQLAALSDTVIYKIDVPANRYDLLCMEGISRALRIFLREMDPPNYTVVASGTSQTHVITVRPATAHIRPYIVCAVLRDVTFTQERYESFIDLQDQLHRNICRQRTLVAIGTHDLDTLQGPFSYDAIPGDQIQFVPLTHTSSSRVFTATELLEHYETEPACKHLKPYVPIIKHSPVYPVVLDSNRTVLSLPPIINGSHSRIQLTTTNIFIECTATDLTKANIVLDTVVAMFSEYAAQPFTVEPVEVQYVDESGNNTIRSYVTPIMYTRQESTSVDFVNSLIGIHLTPEQMVQLCNKVQLGPASLIGPQDNQQLQVTVPPTRSDILHAVDIAEDIGIAYGYNNIVRRIPTTSSVGAETSLNKLSDLLREEISRAGYIEVLTHGLCSIQDNFTALQRPTRLHSAVALSNPANVEYQVVRTSLLPGLLKTLEHNKAMSFAHGFKVFEISDVVLVDTSHVITHTIIGAKNSRRICAVYASTTSGFEIIHGLVDRIMTLTEVAPDKAYIENSLKKGAAGGADSEEKYRISREGWYYTIRELHVSSSSSSSILSSTNDERLVSAATDAGYSYFPGRAAEILLSRPHVSGGSWIPIGTFGILHPLVLNSFNIQYPSSCVELDLEPLL